MGMRRDGGPSSYERCSFAVSLNSLKISDQKMALYLLDPARTARAISALSFGSEGQRIDKKQDKLGRWRLAKVPDYSRDTRAYAINERMKELGAGEAHTKELLRIIKAERLPTGWATPEQKSRAAIKAVRT
jgi:hypothetical protein